MKVHTILFLATISSFCFSNVFSASSIDRTKTYQKIDSVLSTFQRDISRELTSVKSRINSDDKSQTRLLKNLHNYKSSVNNIHKHLVNARNSYTNYHKLRNRKITEQTRLLQSLARQRSFINQERRYINHMENESVKLSPYTAQYKVIRNEVRQMRTQVNKEIADVVRAYNILLAKANRDKNTLTRQRSNKLNQLNSYTRTYYTLLGRYNTLHKNYVATAKSILKRKNTNTQLKKDLENQLDLLQELKTVLQSMKRLPSGSAYKKKYLNCMNTYRVYRNKVRAANCTV